MGVQKFFSSLFVVALIGITACGDDDPKYIFPPQANNSPAPVTVGVRILHGSPDAPAVDLLVDGKTVATDVPYLTSTAYLPLQAGERNFKVNVAGTTQSVIDATTDLGDFKAYTVIAANLVNAIEPLILEDDLAAPDAGYFKLRVVHGAPSAGPVDVYFSQPNVPLSSLQPAIPGFLFKDNSGYLDIPAGTYQVRVTPTGSQTVVIDSGALTLDAGKTLTAIAVDASGAGAPFGLKVLDEQADAGN